MSPAPPAPDPALGPRVLFFSGGTALRGVSRLLPSWTHRSVHLITPFDSGGSSAALRRSLSMPAVGDLRNRLLALADVTTEYGRVLHDALARRLPADGTTTELRQGLRDALRALPGEAAAPLHACLEAVGPRFDLRHASVGNLVLAGMYLMEGRSLAQATSRFAALVGARGTVLPTSESDLHLAAELVDGRVVVGQHRITQGTADEPPIRRIFVVRSLEDPAPAPAPALPAALEVVPRSDLICFPVGSFFTSVVASVLPDGIGAAVAAASASLLYLPNPGGDAEERGWSPDDRVRALAGSLTLPRPARIQVARELRLRHGDPSRYDDAALLDALRSYLTEG